MFHSLIIYTSAWKLLKSNSSIFGIHYPQVAPFKLDLYLCATYHLDLQASDGVVYSFRL